MVSCQDRSEFDFNVKEPGREGAFQSDVVQYKNQIPPNPPFEKGGLGGIWMSHPSKATSL
jgi:hypothetical protein